MTAAAIKKVTSLSTEIRKNSAKVESKISRRGKSEDRGFVVSGAKYYIALKNLADK